MTRNIPEIQILQWFNRITKVGLVLWVHGNRRLASSYSTTVYIALCGSPTRLGLPEWTECCKQNSRFASLLTDDKAENCRRLHVAELA